MEAANHMWLTELLNVASIIKEFNISYYLIFIHFKWHNYTIDIVLNNEDLDPWIC